MKVNSFISLFWIVQAALFFPFVMDSQQLDVKKLGPFPVFEYDDLYVAPSGDLYITAANQREIYHSIDGVDWDGVDRNDIGRISRIEFFSDDQILFTINDTLKRLDELGAVEVIYEGGSGFSNRNVSFVVNNDVIYINKDDKLLVSTDKGNTFEERFALDDSTKIIQSMVVSNSDIYLLQDSTLLVLDDNFEIQRTEKVNPFSNQFFQKLQINDDGIIVLMQISSAAGVDGGSYYRARITQDSGKSWYTFSEGCVGPRVVLTNSYIYLFDGINMLAAYDLGGEVVNRSNRIGTVSTNGDKTYLYSNNKLIAIDEGLFEYNNRIDPNIKFENNRVSSFRLASNGDIYILATNQSLYGHTLLVSADYGDSWKEVDVNGELILSFDIDVNDSVHILTNRSYYVTNDYGATYLETAHDLFFNTALGIGPAGPQPPAGINGPFNEIHVIDSNYLVLSATGNSCSGLAGPISSFVSSDRNLVLDYDYIEAYNYKYILLNDSIYAFSNDSGLGAGVFNQTSRSQRPIFTEYPSNVLIVNENQIHFNEPTLRSDPNLKGGVSYVTTDFGQTFEPLSYGPRGSIHKGPGAEGTYVFNGRLYYRESFDGDYSEVDLSSISRGIRSVKSDDEGQLYLYDSSGELYILSNTIFHQQSITGSLYIDESMDCNGINASLVDQNWIVKVEGDNYSVQSYINDDTYDIRVPVGDYTVEVIPPSSRWIICDSEQEVSLTEANSSAQVDFYFHAAEERCDDVSVSITRSILRRCNERPIVFAISNNTNDIVQNPVFKITHDPLLSFQNIELPHEQVDTFVFISLDDLQPFEYLELQMNMGVSCEAELGMVHCLSGELVSENKCSDSAESSFTTYDLNVGPFDPNDIRVFNEAGHQALTFDKEDWHTYYVRFQNTGTDTAFDVRVNTILDDSLDVSTLRMINASHKYTTSFNDASHLVVRFDDIMLPDSNVNLLGSQGYFTFRVRPISSVEYGTELSTYSNIYFDYNDPITTNQGKSIIDIPCEITYEYRDEDICTNERDYLDSLQVFRSGLYDIFLKSDCDYRIILNANLLRGYEYDDNNYICEDEVVPGFIDTTIVEKYVIANGCDSIINHNYITVDWDASLNFDREVTSCGRLEFGEYTETGVYIDTFRRANGCYIRTLDLKMENRDSITTTICQGNNYLGYTTTGIYGNRIRNGSCDSLLVIDLTVLEPQIAYKDTTICQGEEYLGFSEVGIHVINISEDSICQQNIISLNILDQDDPSCISTSTDEIETSMVQINPNPSDGIFYLEWLESEVPDLKIAVYTVSGAKVHTSIYSKKDQKLDLSESPAGLYYVHLRSDHASQMIKIVKE